MKKKNLDTLYVFSSDDLYKAYDEITLPDGIVLNGTDQIDENKFDLFIGDVESFVKCLSWMGQKNCVPEKIILLQDNFNPLIHVKKETIIIPDLESLSDEGFWNEFYSNTFEGDNLNVYNYFIGSIFEIGGIVDQINFQMIHVGLAVLEVQNSIFKLSQFVSSLFYNNVIKNGVHLGVTLDESRKSIALLLDIPVIDLDPVFLLDYLHFDDHTYSKRLLSAAFQTSTYAKLEYDKKNVRLDLRFSEMVKNRGLLVRIDKAVGRLKSFIDPEKLSAESSGILSDFSKDIDLEHLQHPGVLHMPKFDEDKKANVEEIIIKVLGQKENYLDDFDVIKVKEILSEDPDINVEGYTDDEMQRICELINDVESTVVFARAQEDVFDQVADNNEIGEELIRVIDELKDEELPVICGDKSEISLEDDGKVIIKEPAKISIEDDEIIIGSDKFKSDDFVQRVGGVTDKIKEEVIKVKGDIKSKDDIEKIVFRVMEKESPDLIKFSPKIAKNLVSGFVSKKMNNIVRNGKSWKKMNEMITSYKKKLDQKDKEIESLNNLIDTLRGKEKEFHPVFREIMDEHRGDDKKNDETKKLEMSIKRKDHYIQTLERKLVDKQFSEIKVIKSERNEMVNNQIILRKKEEDIELFSDKNEQVLADFENDKLNPLEDGGKKNIAELEKFKAIGKSMAKKLSDQSTTLSHLKVKNIELLEERKALIKEKQRLGMVERRSSRIIKDLEARVIAFETEIARDEKNISGGFSKKIQNIENVYQKKVRKLEELNKKLSNGTKSLAKKLTSLQNEHVKLKNDKRVTEHRLRHNENELARLKDSIKKQKNKKAKAS